MGPPECPSRAGGVPTRLRGAVLTLDRPARHDEERPERHGVGVRSGREPDGGGGRADRGVGGLTIYDLRFTIYDLRSAVDDRRLTIDE